MIADFLLPSINAFHHCGMRFCRFHEFGEDGGPAAKELAPKVAGLQDFLESKLGAVTPKIDVMAYTICYASYLTR